MFLTAVRHEVNNLESSVVVQELELAINLALYGFLWSLLSNLYNFWSHSSKSVVSFFIKTSLKRVVSRTSTHSW